MLVRRAKKLVKFSIVGGTGTIINLSIFYTFLVFFDFGHNFSAIFAFLIAVSSNFFFNSIWTFAGQSKRRFLKYKNYFNYFIGNIIGLVINLITLNFFVTSMPTVSILSAQIFSIACATLFNFIFANYFIFK
jgi:putative flippase GtrA